MKILFLIPCLFAGLTSGGLRADEPVASSIKFSHPDKPETVRIYVAQGTLKIFANTSNDTVTVNTDAQPEKKNVTRPDGLRVIGSSASFSLTENENVVELNYGRDSVLTANADFTVEVPRNASIEVSNGMGAEIRVDDVMGDIEIKNMNGEVRLNNIGGGALVETMNGEIHATFATMPTNKALSFTSMNGEIEVHLPADAKANVRFRTQNGSILTDFPEDVMKTKSSPASPSASAEAARIARGAARQAAEAAKEVAEQVRDAIHEASDEMQDNGTAHPRAPRAPRPPRPPSIPAMVGGKVVSGALNGGGVDLQIATMNGDIVVRKNAPKP